MDGVLNESGRVVIDQIFEARRKVLAQAFQVRLDQSRSLYRVGAGREIDAEPARRLTVNACFDVLVPRAELDSPDVTNAQKRAVGVGAQHDVAELLGRRQPILRL